MPESAKEGARPLAESSDIGLGPGDRAFEPHYSDQNPSEIIDFRGIFLFFVYCGAGGWTDFHKQYSLGYYSSMCTLLALIECSLLPK